LIIDMINEFSFEDADKMFPAILTTAERIAELKRRVKTAGFPVIYVNDKTGGALPGRALSRQGDYQTVASG
jgi:isochorismate hydrolase